MIGELPEPFRSNIAGAFASGAAWLHSLPSLVTECEARWKITAGAPFALSFNYVTPAVTSGGQAVVLKLGMPGPELSWEIQALEAYAGKAAVRVLDPDRDRGVMLLERVPGELLNCT